MDLKGVESTTAAFRVFGRGDKFLVRQNYFLQVSNRVLRHLGSASEWSFSNLISFRLESLWFVFLASSERAVVRSLSGWNRTSARSKEATSGGSWSSCWPGKLPKTELAPKPWSPTCPSSPRKSWWDFLCYFLSLLVLVLALLLRDTFDTDTGTAKPLGACYVTTLVSSKLHCYPNPCQKH